MVCENYVLYTAQDKAAGLHLYYCISGKEALQRFCSLRPLVIAIEEKHT